MNGLDAIATGIMTFEGPFRPKNKNFMNCNPGNIRSPLWKVKDTGGYDIYPDVVWGYEALLDDLSGKFTGKNSHGLGPQSTLGQLFQIYAPTADQNDPASYASFIATWLTMSLGKLITVQSTLAEIWTPTA